MNHLNTTQAIENQLLSITKLFGYEYEFSHNKYNYSLVDGKMYREGKNDDYFEMKVNEVDNCFRRSLFFLSSCKSQLYLVIFITANFFDFSFV